MAVSKHFCVTTRSGRASPSTSKVAHENWVLASQGGDGAWSLNGKLGAEPVGRLQAVGVEAKPAPVFL
jgi:hypothetical protein